MLGLSAVMGGAIFAIFLIFYLALIVTSIVAMAKIISKAGYSAWFVLLVFVPLVNIVMMIVFAFSDWPMDRELRWYRQGGFGPGPGGYPRPPWSGQPFPGYDPSRSPYPPPPPAGQASWQPPPPPPPPAGQGSWQPYPAAPPPAPPPPAPPPGGSS